MNQRVWWLVVLGLLAGCATLSEGPILEYRLADAGAAQTLDRWYFEGRLSFVDERESVSASVNWRHSNQVDEIELVGPLAQGRVRISVSGDVVAIDDGEARRELRGDVDSMVEEGLGISLPISALRFWVLGASQPESTVTVQSSGFFQLGWLVIFQEMLQVERVALPRKMSVQRDKTRIKLFVDRWDLS